MIYIFSLVLFLLAYLIIHTLLIALLIWFVVCKLNVDMHFRRGTLMTNTEPYDAINSDT